MISPLINLLPYLPVIVLKQSVTDLSLNLPLFCKSETTDAQALETRYETRHIEVLMFQQ